MADPVILSEHGLVSLPDGSGPPERGEAARLYARLARWIAVTDILGLEVALILTRLLRRGFASWEPDFVLLLGIAPLVWVGVFAALQLYSLSRLSPVEEFRGLIGGSAIAVVIVGVVVRRDVAGVLSQGWLVLAWFVALTLVLIGRQVWHRRMGRMRASGRLAYRTLIVGANDEAVRIAETLGPKPYLGFFPVGFLRTDTISPRLNGLPVLGTAEDLSEVVRANSVDCVFVAASAVTSTVIKHITRELRGHQVEVRVSANLTEILSSRLTVQPVGDLLALSLRPVRLSGRQAVAKRTFDIVVGGIAVILSSPLWITAALLIKLTSRGPVLFKQERVGRNARPFTMYKFRTMVQGAEALLAQLEDRNEASGPLFKIREDPRITRVGRLLRRYSIDELPQLLNVLKGEMSLVGPRPPLAREVAIYEDWHRGRLEVKPGITGLWQVGGRSELSFDDYVRLDLFYIENWSISYDLYLLGKTIPAVLVPKGAY